MSSKQLKADAALAELKKQLGVHHDYLDGWYHSFLENKHFNVAETVAKLERRAQMEQQEFRQYTMTPSMRKTMSTGVLQMLPGSDKDGMPVVYIVTKRDFPKAEEREERRKNLDMWLAYATRLTSTNRACRVTWLINQKGASLWSNTDLTFQREIITRIAKYFPNCQHRLYVCNMSNSLSFVVKPLIKAAPAAIADCIMILSEKDVSDGKLLEYFDASMLPVDLGGEGDFDVKASWEAFANDVTSYTNTLVKALGATAPGPGGRGSRPMDVKTFEMMEAFGVDAHGHTPPPLEVDAAPAAVEDAVTATPTDPLMPLTTPFQHNVDTKSAFANPLVQDQARPGAMTSPEPHITFDLLPQMNTSNLMRFQDDWYAAHSTVKQQHRIGTAALMWFHLETYATQLHDLNLVLLATRRSIDGAPPKPSGRLAAIDGNVSSNAVGIALDAIACQCCGLPSHHSLALSGSRRELIKSVQTLLSYWSLLRPAGCASDRLMLGADVNHFLQWALGADAASSTRMELYNLAQTFVKGSTDEQGDSLHKPPQ